MPLFGGDNLNILKEKELYMSLLETGQLRGYTGEWEEDKKRFLKYQKELEDLLGIR